MENNLQVFKDTEFGELGVLVFEGKEYFPATECAKTLGYKDTTNAIKQHCRWVVKHKVPHPQNPTKIIEMNFIPEGDLFRLIIKSNLPSAEKFERWVFDDVLPTIRKHGIYATEKVINEMITNPEFGIKLLTQLKAERDKSRQLKIENAQKQQIIGELTPKATYYDLILQNNSLVPITQIAKDYGMSGRAMNAMLHDLKVQYKMGNTWLLYQVYADMGYTQSKTHVIDADKSVMHTYWAQKGRLFLYDLLKNKRNLLPVIERIQITA